MKCFYGLWFFFCAGWGYLLAQPWPAETARPLTDVFLIVPAAALSFFVLLAIELSWRYRGKVLTRPSLTLPPWKMPIGLFQFIFLTFLFSSIWGVILLFATGGSEPPGPLVQAFSMSIGGLLALMGTFYVYRSRFEA